MKKVICILLIALLTSCKSNIDEEIDLPEEVDDIVTNEIIDSNENETQEGIQEGNTYIYTDNYNVYNNYYYNEDNIESEEDLVDYFTSLKDDLKEKLDSSTSWQSIKEYTKETLSKIYGFCFKGEEIGGYTFDELSSTTKEKIINIVLNIDEFITEKYPNYKDDFKDSYSNMIDSFKESLSVIKDTIRKIIN